MSSIDYLTIYGQVAARLKRDIKLRKYREGQRLPREVDLARQLGVARKTLRRALDILEQDSLIVRRRSRGTFVAGGEGVLPETKLLRVVLQNSEFIFSREKNLNYFGITGILSGLNSAATEKFCSMDFVSLNSGVLTRKTFDMICDFNGRCPDGLFFLQDNLSVLAEIAASENIPYLIWARRFTGKLNNVCVNTRKGVFDAVSYLINKGRSRIAYLGPEYGTFGSFKSRFDGYKEALEAHGIAFEPHYVEECDGAEMDGCEAMRKIMAGNPDIDAVFAATDIRAVGAMKAVREKGLRIPEDIAVIGYDNIDDASLCEPPLASIDKLIPEQTKLAVEALLNYSERRQPFTIEVEPQLAIRESAG